MGGTLWRVHRPRMDGQPVRSCMQSLAHVGGSEVTTIEAIAGPVADAVKSAWIKNNVPQCGYCQSGQIMSAVALLETNPKPSRDDINSAMSGNHLSMRNVPANPRSDCGRLECSWPTMSVRP